MRYWINLFVAAIVVGLMAAGAKAYLPQQPLVIVDQNFFVPEPIWEGYNGTLSKPAIAPVLPAGRNLVLLITGEGNSASISPTQYTPVNSANIFNVNIFDGGLYPGADPLLGSTPWGRDSGTSINALGQTVGPGFDQNACAPNCGSNGSWATRLADLLINDGTVDNVLLVPISIYGLSVTFWGTDVTHTGPPGCPVLITCLWKRAQVACNRLSAFGVVPHFGLWGQGESDSQQPNVGTYYHPSFVDFFTKANVVCTSHGNQLPWLMSIESYIAGSGIDPALQAAQQGLINNLTIFPGADIDSIGPMYRTGPAGSTYLDDNGMAIAAQLWRSAIYSYGLPF